MLPFCFLERTPALLSHYSATISPLLAQSDAVAFLAVTHPTVSAFSWRPVGIFWRELVAMIAVGFVLALHTTALAAIDVILLVRRFV